MDVNQRMLIQATTSEIVSTVLGLFNASELAAQEQSAADMVAVGLVAWNRGEIGPEQLCSIRDSSNAILEAVRVRRHELRAGTMSLGADE